VRIVTAPAGPRQPFFSLILLTMAAVLFTSPVYALPDRFPANRDAILLTIFLKHDQSKTLDEIQTQLKKQGFYKNFPPQGGEVVSWYVMMGMGQVVTLRVPAARLREVNLAIEHSAWGAFRPEFYAPYDYKPIWQEERKKVQGK
jgi:hypothetical protein